MIKSNKIHQGDCLQIMGKVEDRSIDLILCDLPYGVTANPKDKIIDLKKLWQEYSRIIKERGKIVLTSQFPFTIDLINSKREWFRYDLVWNKILTSGFLNANRMPLRLHEHILVFYNKEGTYNPQKSKGYKNHSKGSMKSDVNNNYGKYGKIDNSENLGELKHPQSIVTISKPHPSKAMHPTEKPIALAEYLIKTYSNEGDLVLDNCIGVGWTAIACAKSNRNFIGIELNSDFVKIAEERLNNNLFKRTETEGAVNRASCHFSYKEIKQGSDSSHI